MDTITPDDLLMYHKARERFELTKQQVQQAQQVFAQAQQAHIAAAGWLEGAVETIRTRPGFPEGGSFHPETGAIVLGQQAQGQVPAPPPVPIRPERDPSHEFGRRKKGA